MIESLENNEVILLMYMADELPPQDREDVERMLLSDLGLRAELDHLLAASDVAHELIGAADEASAGSLAARQPIVVRRIGRALRQEIAAKASKIPAASPQVGLRYPWWIYPTASAAAVLLAMLTWWGNSSSVGPHGLPALPHRQLVLHDPVNDPNDANIRMANEIERVFSTNNDADNALLALRDDHSAAGLDLDGQ